MCNGYAYNHTHVCGNDNRNGFGIKTTAFLKEGWGWGAWVAQ